MTGEVGAGSSDRIRDGPAEVVSQPLSGSTQGAIPARDEVGREPVAGASGVVQFHQITHGQI
jgi:hypothetical protein